MIRFAEVGGGTARPTGSGLVPLAKKLGFFDREFGKNGPQIQVNYFAGTGPAINQALAQAKTAAEEANLSKTRFLAAAGHDILQPLNAARLYASSLAESVAAAGPDERAALARNVDASLEAVEEILGALLDISRLDAGAKDPQV